MNINEGGLRKDERLSDASDVNSHLRTIGEEHTQQRTFVDVKSRVVNGVPIRTIKVFSVPHLVSVLIVAEPLLTASLIGER